MQPVLYDHVFALLISMTRFNSTNFFQNRPKIVIFAKKKNNNNANFRALGVRPHTLPFHISDYAPAFSWLANSVILS